MAENSGANIIPPAPEVPAGDKRPPGDELMRVAELIANKKPEPEQTAAPAETEKTPSFDELLTGTGEAPPPSKSQLEALAETAGSTVEDLYKTEIPMKNREPMTLGELKDLAAKQLQQTEWDEQRQQAENNLLKQQQELAQAVALLGDNLTPELVEQARQRNEQHMLQQRQLLLNVMPQLNDPEVLQQTQERVGNVLASYGFQPQEAGALIDHRMIKLVSDFGELHARFEQAAQRMQKIQKNAAPAARKSPATKEPTQTTTGRRTSTNDKVNDVLGILAKAGANNG